MVNYREILRLDHEGISQRQIAVSVGSSRNKVSEVLETATAKHIEWPLEDTITNAQLEEILFPDKYYLLSNFLMPDFEHIHKELGEARCNADAALDGICP